MNFDLDKDVFLKDYQTKKPFLRKKAFEPDLSWENVDEIISRCDISSQDFKLNYNGRVLDKNEYIEKYEDIGLTRYRLIRENFYSFMRKGATVIANKISNEPIIYKYRREIEHFCGRPTIASLYLAYGKDSSFRAHWDSRDVFVLQIEGKKKWTLYEPNFELPLNHQQSKDMPEYQCPTTPFMEVTLEKGDILYVPRGWWHDPIPLDEASLHLSVGTYPFYPRDYLNWILNLVPGKDIYARKDLLSFEESLDDLKKFMGSVYSNITNEDLFNVFRSQLEDKVYRTESPLNLNILAKPNPEKVIPSNAILDLNIINNVSFDLNNLVINGIKVNLSDDSVKIIKFLIKNPMIQYSEIIKKFNHIDCNKIKDLVFDLCTLDIIGIYKCNHQ